MFNAVQIRGRTTRVILFLRRDPADHVEMAGARRGEASSPGAPSAIQFGASVTPPARQLPDIADVGS